MQTRKKGKLSRRLFEELIFSTLAGAWLTEEERGVVEKRMISDFASMAVCRTAWHVDEKTGRCDLHVLLSAKNMDYPPAVTFWANYGGCDSNHIYAEMDNLDAEITRYLSRTPERQKAKLKTAREKHLETTVSYIGEQIPFSIELALYFRKRNKSLELDNDTITEAIKSLGHEVTKIKRRTISIQFRGCKTSRNYNLIKLVDDVVVTIERLRSDSPTDPADPSDPK